ncbi:MAG TPA: hypothetical protein VJU86_10895 [Pyrinomonadaceae bacterium]|nr:hypothetical protein [Pyrinomonadaceae bacterium]
MKTVRGKMHHKFITLIAIAVVALTLVPSVLAHGDTTLHQNKQDFTLHNETGLEITEVYVSPTGVDDWEEDVLGTDTLATGDSVAISFSRRKEEMWDIKVVFRNGKNSVWTKFNLSQITDITISFKNGKPWATWKNGDQ